MQNSLVAYRKEPAQVIAEKNNKFELLLANGKTLSVRRKDFFLVHNKYQKIIINKANTKPNIEILKDFSEEELDIADLCLWLFDDNSPQSAWQTYELTLKQIYCYTKIDKIFIRPTHQAQKILADKNTAKLAQEQLLNFITRLENNNILASDKPYLQEIVGVALNQKKYSKLLNELKLDNNPQEAHKLLLKIGFYSQDFNPYPARYKCQLATDINTKLTDRATNRLDLSHLNSYAIDNNNTNDADDAISIDGDTIWVHIADIGAFITPDSELDNYAKIRTTNIYLPEQTITMLPEQITNQLALGLNDKSLALSVGFSLINNIISDIKIHRSIIKVIKLNYDIVNDNINKYPQLLQLQQLTKKHKLWRRSNNSMQLNLPKSQIKYQDKKVFFNKNNAKDIRDLVAEMMIIAGRAIALFANEKQIAIPFLTQEQHTFTKEDMLNQDNLSITKQFAIMRNFKRSSITTKANYHSGMGLDIYTRFTSPLRRYFDLLVHQQLHCYLDNKPTLDNKQIKSIIKNINKLTPAINKTIRDSNKHYQCLYFIQNPNWSGDAVVINYHNNKAFLFIDNLSITAECKYTKNLTTDDIVNIKLKSVDIVNLEIKFVIESSK